MVVNWYQSTARSCELGNNSLYWCFLVAKNEVLILNRRGHLVWVSACDTHLTLATGAQRRPI